MIAWSAHLSTLFDELPVLARPAAARAAGLGAVETWWPPAPDPGDWIAAVTGAGVTAALVNADGGDLARGERGYCNDPARAGEVVAAVAAALRVAVACGGDTVNLLVGRDDGRRPRAEQLAAAREAVRAAGEEAARLGGRIVIEHLNPHDVAGALVATPAEAAAFVADVDHPAVAVLFDAYHCARAGLDPAAEFTGVADVVGHVQYADSPGRGAPGTGTVDLAAFVDHIHRAGYSGHVGLEFTAPGATAEALAALPAPP